MRYWPQKSRKVRVIIEIDDSFDGPGGGLRHLKNIERSSLNSSLSHFADELSEFLDYLLTLGIRRGTFGVLKAAFASLSLSLFKARETAQEVVNSMARTEHKPRTLNTLLDDPAVLHDAFAGVDKKEETESDSSDTSEDEEPDLSAFSEFLESLDLDDLDDS